MYVCKKPHGIARYSMARSVTGRSLAAVGQTLYRTTGFPGSVQTPPMCFQPQSFVFTLRAISWGSRGPVSVELLLKGHWHNVKLFFSVDLVHFWNSWNCLFKLHDTTYLCTAPVPFFSVEHLWQTKMSISFLVLKMHISHIWVINHPSASF